MATLTSVFGANLGDTLWVTPLAQYVPDLVVWMRLNDLKAERTSAILQHTCARLMKEDPPETLKASVRGHVTQQILTAYGHGGKPSIPRVTLTATEIKGAIRYLADLGVNPAKAVALVSHTSGWKDPINARAQYTRGNGEMYSKIASFWRGAGYKVLQFGPAPDFYSTDVVDPIEGTIPVRGLSVRELAAVYHVVGKLVSCDTGDYHLGLAVGARVVCLAPEHSDHLGYRHWDLHYDSVCWGDEQPRVKYILHDDWTQALDLRVFRDMGAPEQSL